MENLGLHKDENYPEGSLDNPRIEACTCEECGNNNFMVYLVGAGATTSVGLECRVCGHIEPSFFD